MNKKKFIEELESVTGLDKDKCVIVNDILESNFIVGKKNKEKIVSNLMEQLNLTTSEADILYDSAMSIIGSGIKDKLKHPFKSND